MGHARLVDKPSTKEYPNFLKQLISKTQKLTEDDHPIVIKMDEKDAKAKLEETVKDRQVNSIADNYDEQYAELLLSQNAHLYRANFSVQKESIRKLLGKHYGKKQPWQLGSWVYFPWNKTLAHVLSQSDFEQLRSIRNRDLITNEEQKKLAEFKVACFGMSVGSAGALALAISGISRQIKLIDGAVISGSNLNRILTGVPSVGEQKCRVVGRQIYEMNPYSEVEYFDKATAGNIEEILGGDNPVDLAIDEIDDIEMKLKIRLQAKKLQIPVLMATELADTVMLDIERFDLEPSRKIFHGKIKEVEKVAARPPKNYREWTKLAVGIIDPINMPLRMQKSLLKIGTNIVTHPQLGSTVMVTGGILAFAAKNIALGQSLNSGRYVISLEKTFLAEHKTIRHRRSHKKHTKIIKKSVSSM